MVNGVPILRVDFIAQLRSVHDVSLSEATLAQKQAVLDDMIAEELAVQRGVELGMAVDDTDTRSALVAAVRGELATDVTAVVPSDVELQHFYEAHREQYASEGRMALHWYVLPATAAVQAATAVAEFRAGTPLEQVVARHGLRSTGKVDDGEEYYFAAALHLGQHLFAVARTLRGGEVSDPIAEADGLSILVMTHNQAPEPQTFEQIQDRVREDYAREKLQSVEAANARFLRDRATIRIGLGSH